MYLLENDLVSFLKSWLDDSWLVLIILTLTNQVSLIVHQLK